MFDHSLIGSETPLFGLRSPRGSYLKNKIIFNFIDSPLQHLIDKSGSIEFCLVFCPCSQNRKPTKVRESALPIIEKFY